MGEHSASPPKVHFPSEQVKSHDAEILIHKSADDHFTIHLGFLQIHRQYEVHFSTLDDYTEDLVADPLQNVHIKILDIRPTEDGKGHEFLLDLDAYKEKLMKEELVVTDPKLGKTIKLTISARVLGKGKGTPSLKNGIRCTGMNVQDDSDTSDWQGFD